MSKSKMKKKVLAANTPPEEPKQKTKQKTKQKRERKKWTKMRDFQYIKPVKFLPGFRTGKHWKRIVALVYFSLTPFSLVLRFGEAMPYFGVFVFITLLTLPFMICSFATYMNTKDKFYAKEALIAAAIFAADNIALTYCLNNILQQLQP